MNWEEYNLGQLVSLKQGFALNKKSQHHLSGDNSGLPLLKISDLINGTETLFVKTTIPEQFLVTPSEIIYSRTGQVGLAFMGKTGVVYNNCFKVIPNEKLDSVFIFHWLNSKQIRDYIKSLATGAAQPDLNHDAFKSVKINLPPLPTQKRIASILSAYDDLIENNLKRIKLLEETAQNIYKEWFVHFRFPNYEHTAFDEESGLPVGWEIKKLSHFIDFHIGGGWGNEQQESEFTDSAYVIRGTDMPDIKLGMFTKIPFRFHKSSNLKSRKIEPNDIVFEVSGGSAKYPVGRSILLNSKILENFGNESVMCASFCKLIRPKNEIIPSIFLSMFLDNIYFDGTLAQYENRSASNIVNFKFETFLEKQEVCIPPKELLNEFEKIATPIFDLKTTLGIEISKLKEARDILLPRLMNRTIEV